MSLTWLLDDTKGCKTSKCRKSMQIAKLCNNVISLSSMLCIHGSKSNIGGGLCSFCTEAAKVFYHTARTIYWVDIKTYFEGGGGDLEDEEVQWSGDDLLVHASEFVNPETGRLVYLAEDGTTHKIIHISSSSFYISKSQVTQAPSKSLKPQSPQWLGRSLFFSDVF